MTPSAARLTVLLVLGMLAPPALAFAGQQHPHESARSTESGGHHHIAQPQPHAQVAAPTMPGLSSAQVLSGPLPMFPAPPASPFSAAPSTYLPHRGISPFLRPRPSIVIGGLAFGGDAPSETTPPTAGRADTPTIETPVAAQPPEAQPPDIQPPGAPAPSAAPTALTPVTLYVIPGCYAGDRLPVDGILSAGCDVARIRTVRIR